MSGGGQRGTTADAPKASSGLPTVSSLALVGFMGAGKSAVGVGVAHRRSLPFVDTDALIEEQMGPIAEIFAVHGEAHFRTVERDVCMGLLERARAAPMVVSLGGGAVLGSDVRAALRGVAHVAWLTAPPDVLWERVAAEGEAAVRPLARDRAAFAALLAEREPLYREVATAIVDNGVGRTVDEVVDELVRLTESSVTARHEGA
ncbi:MAG: shikimate kinase [Thermoleophilia bacterium]|nr:shikimate kinase [Thermoleophilia bacterium]